VLLHVEISGAEVTEEDKASELLQPSVGGSFVVCKALLTPQSACGIFTCEADTLVFLPVHAGAGGSAMNVHCEDLRAPGSAGAWPRSRVPRHKGTRGQPQRYLWEP